MKDSIYIPPSPPICISNFSSVASKMTPPFRANFRGMVQNLMDLDVSLSGVNKRKFKLVDLNGAWFFCCAHGVNAVHASLSNNSEIVLYFGTGRGAIGSDAAAVYAFKDACIIKVASHAVAWPMRTEIMLQ